MTNVNVSLVAESGSDRRDYQTDWDRWFTVFKEGYAENMVMGDMRYWPSQAQKYDDFIPWFYNDNIRRTDASCRAAGRRAFRAWCRNNGGAFLAGCAPASPLPGGPWLWILMLLLVAVAVARG